MENDQVSNQDTNTSSDSGEKDKVDYKSFEKLLGQRKADKARMEEMSRQVEEYRNALELYKQKEKEAEEVKNKESGNYKALVETREKEINDLQKKLEEYQARVNDSEENFNKVLKLSAFNESIGGKIKHKRFYDLVELDKIAIDPETKKVDEKSLKDYVKNFTSEFKDIIEFKDARLPERQAGESSSYSYDDYVAALNSGDVKKARTIMGKINSNA